MSYSRVNWPPGVGLVMDLMQRGWAMTQRAKLVLCGASAACLTRRCGLSLRGSDHAGCFCKFPGGHWSFIPQSDSAALTKFWWWWWWNKNSLCEWIINKCTPCLTEWLHFHGVEHLKWFCNYCQFKMIFWKAFKNQPFSLRESIWAVFQAKRRSTCAVHYCWSSTSTNKYDAGFLLYSVFLFVLYCDPYLGLINFKLSFSFIHLSQESRKWGSALLNHRRTL